MCDRDYAIFLQLALEPHICGQNISTFSLLLQFPFYLGWFCPLVRIFWVVHDISAVSGLNHCVFLSPVCSPFLSSEVISEETTSLNPLLYLRYL